MSKRILPILAILLIAATAAQAQGRGGGGGGGGGRGGGRGGGGGQSRAPSTPKADAPPAPPPTAVNQIEMVGVIKAIDPDANRITIAYEPVEALNWPAGTQPFPVGKAAVYEGATVGEKVRFKLDSHQISDLRPY